MKKIALLLICSVLLVGCSSSDESETRQYNATFLTLFDTVTVIMGSAESEDEFQALVQPVYDGLEHYHRLFDIYNEYDGIVNLKTVNDKAAVAPVYVSDEMIEFLEDCKYFYEMTEGAFNPAMGAVLRLWHDARTDGVYDPQNAYLPEFSELENAAMHISPDDIVLDTENSTVYFSDPHLKIDVGGIAKGWAVQRVCEEISEGLLISVGGNVYASGPKNESGAPWSVGIRDPENNGGHLHNLNITKGSVVTSGNYIRNYRVNGKLYHHIIDPVTLYPGELWTSVTIVCEDSGVADVLATALFLLDFEKGTEILSRFGAEAMWVDSDGNKLYSSGYRKYIRNDLEVNQYE